jgi:hypothetical protein
MIAWLVCVSVALPAAVFYWYQRQLRMQDTRQHAESAALRERVAHLERQCAAAIEHLTEARDDMQALSNTVRERDAALAEVRAQRDEARTQIASLAAQLDAATRRGDALERRVAQLVALADARAAAERDETMKLLAFSDQLHSDAAASAESMRRERDAAINERDTLAHKLAATDALRLDLLQIAAERDSLRDQLAAERNNSSVGSKASSAAVTPRSSAEVAALASASSPRSTPEPLTKDKSVLPMTLRFINSRLSSRASTGGSTTGGGARPRSFSLASAMYLKRAEPENAAAIAEEEDSSSDNSVDIVGDRKAAVAARAGNATDNDDDDDDDDDDDEKDAVDGDASLMLAARTRTHRSESVDLSDLKSLRRNSGSLRGKASATALSITPPPSPPRPTMTPSTRASVELTRLWAAKWANATALLVRVQALARGARARREYLFRRRRAHIVAELVETEESYVAHLRHMVGICHDLLAQCVLPQRVVCKMFINVEVLAYFNGEFLSILQSTVAAQPDAYDAKIGNMVIFSISNWRAYVYFVNGYSDAVALVQRSEKSLPKLKQFLVKQSQKNLDLYDLLIMPVQRVPRYILLLTELRKFTPDAHPDAHPLDAALRELRTLAAFIDNGAKAAERMRELSAQLVGWHSFPSAINRLCATSGSAVATRSSGEAGANDDAKDQFLHPARRLIKEGHAVALADGKLRLLFLLNDHLLVCKTKGKKIKVKQLIVLTARSTVNQPSKAATGEGAFELEVNGVRFRLQSAEGRTAWFAAIQSSIDEQETLEKIRA